MNAGAEREDDGVGDDDLHAGEYALGVLDAGERRAAQARIDAEPGFAARVAAWDQRFAPWLLAAAPVAVPERLWLRVRSRLGWTVDDGRAPGREPLLRRTGFWQATTVLATAAAIAAVAFALRVRAPDPAAPPPPAVVQAPDDALRAVTVLAGDDGRAAWVVTVDAAHGRVRVAPVPGPAPEAGHAHELWLVPAGGAPASLGALDARHAHTVEVPVALRTALVPGSALAVSVEPAKGIPHAAPTGPVVAQGAIDRI